MLEGKTHNAADLQQMDLIATLSMLENIEEDGVSDSRSRYLPDEVIQVKFRCQL